MGWFIFHCIMIALTGGFWILVLIVWALIKFVSMK